VDRWGSSLEEPLPLAATQGSSAAPLVARSRLRYTRTSESLTVRTST
jgi:hypothetical protein